MSKYKSQLAPFIHTEKNAPYIYLTLLGSLIPCTVCGIYYYGVRAFILILFCMVAFALSDNLIARITRRRADNDYFDFSSLVEGLLLALLLPPDTTLLTALVAVLFASVVTKQIFGGAGSNIINPACAGRLFVELVFPSGIRGFSYGEDNSWLSLSSLVMQGKPVATPDLSQFSFAELISGNFPGMIGTSCVVCIIIGGVFLTLKGSMRLYSPVSYLLTLLVLYPVSMLIGTGSFSFDGLIIYILSSGSVFVAVFLLGDLTTMPSRFTAGVFAGAVCGVLTIVTKPFLDPMVSILSPVLAVNFLSFVLDFFSKTLSRRKIRSREVDVS